jgi:soluble lytic murein transglycosylase-like protein
MSRSFPPVAAAVLFGLALLLAINGARASALYKCNAKDGSIAYTSKQDGFTGCKLISTFADPPKPAASEDVSKANVAKTDRASAKHGWVYEENAKARADFSAITASVSSTAARPVFDSVRRGGASSAQVLVPIPEETPPAPARAVPVVAKASPPLPRILRGAVYKVERKDGITEYTNIKPAGKAFAVLFTYIATCVACDIHSKIDFARTALNIDAFKTEIIAAATDFGVDSALIRAVIHAESAFNPMALSNKGAQGLMQLMPGTAGDLGVTDAFDAAQNIRGGARYLAQLLKDFNGDAQLAIAAYNAGEGAVQKYRGIPPYDETQVYVQRVVTLRDRYQKAM